MSTLYTKISKELDVTIEELAKERGMKKTDLVRELLENGFDADQTISKAESMKDKVLDVEKVKEDISELRQKIEGISELKQKIEALESLDACVNSMDKCLKEEMALVVDFVEKLTARFEELKNWKISIENTLNRKFEIVGKLIDSAMTAIEKTTSAKKCEDDKKGIEVLLGKEEKNHVLLIKEG